MENAIMTIKDYGSIQLKLDKLLEVRRITKNSLARSINSRYEVVDKWCENKVEKLDLDVLARMCFVLDCEVNDIIGYKK